MSPLANQLYDAALRLSEEDREELADMIWRSIDGDTQDEIDAAWAAEIKRRIESSDRGEVTLLTEEEVWERIEKRK